MIALVVVTVVLIVAAVSRRMLVVIVVQGNSMAPTYWDGDRLLVRRRVQGRRCRRGDVAVFHSPARSPDNPQTPGDPAFLVKRVVCVPGDAVPDDVRDVVGRIATVPWGCLVVRGDAAHTLDSRHFGFIPVRSVMGVVIRPLRTVASIGHDIH